MTEKRKLMMRSPSSVSSRTTSEKELLCWRMTSCFAASTRWWTLASSNSPSMVERKKRTMSLPPWVFSRTMSAREGTAAGGASAVWAAGNISSIIAGLSRGRCLNCDSFDGRDGDDGVADCLMGHGYAPRRGWIPAFGDSCIPGAFRRKPESRPRLNIEASLRILAFHPHPNPLPSRERGLRNGWWLPSRERRWKPACGFWHFTLTPTLSRQGKGVTQGSPFAGTTVESWVHVRAMRLLRRTARPHIIGAAHFTQ